MRRSIIILGIVTALMPGVVISDDRPDETRSQARRLAGTTVITNDLLERLYGRSAPVAAPVEVAPQALLMDPVAELQYQLDSRRTVRVRKARAEQRVAAAEQRIRMLQARKLAVVNPYRPRPVLTEAEAAEWEGLDNAARLHHTEEAIREARKELQAARDELAR